MNSYKKGSIFETEYLAEFDDIPSGEELDLETALNKYEKLVFEKQKFSPYLGPVKENASYNLLIKGDWKGASWTLMKNVIIREIRSKEVLVQTNRETHFGNYGYLTLLKNEYKDTWLFLDPRKNTFSLE